MENLPLFTSTSLTSKEIKLEWTLIKGHFQHTSNISEVWDVRFCYRKYIISY